MGDHILTADRVRELLSYDLGSGEFKWIKPRSGVSLKKPAGTVNRNGYLDIRIDRKIYAAHRLAWLYVNGEWPPGMLDHINGNRMDNRILNLRSVSNTVNQQNQRHARADNKVGLLGVNFEKGSGKYKAQIRHNGKKLLVGRFDDPMAAHAAYIQAKRVLHEGCTI